MKKVLLIAGEDADSGHPSLDCLLAASCVLHSEPTGGTCFLLLTSTRHLGAAISLMLQDPPHQLKVIYLDTAPQNEAEIDLLFAEGISAYIFDHHATPFAFVFESAPNIVFSQSASATVTSLVGTLYPDVFANNRPWPRIALLNHFLTFHRCIQPLSREENKEGGFVDLARDLHGKYPALAKLQCDWLSTLVYVCDHVIDQLNSLDWRLAADLVDQSELLDRAGEFISRVLAVHAFMEALVSGDDHKLTAEWRLQAHKDLLERCQETIAEGHLTSVLISGSLFVGAVFVRGSDFPMGPDMASMVLKRAKAQCLVISGENEEGMRVRLQRAVTRIDCREVALSLASGMSPEAVVFGQPWEAFLLCSRDDWRALERRLKLDREEMTWRPPKDAPQPLPRPKPEPLQRRISTRRMPSPTSAASHLSRQRTRTGISSVLSDNVFE